MCKVLCSYYENHKNEVITQIFEKIQEKREKVAIVLPERAIYLEKFWRIIGLLHMIKHIVMWKLKDVAEGSGKMVNARKMKDLLESLKGKIGEVKHIEVGINSVKTDASADVVLYSEFACMKDLDIYQNHPEHVKIVQFVREVCMERRVVDYEI
ncbi:conserved hypothetical protein [Candidatus Jettenia caeni]|uniref:Stress-response A/B barrel domain-containing protein n=2 Tax=Candidatus Jettenia TaxID=360731 RepID=I3IK16_9BACT|nr:conserved hypothetical protein [Candidatus Jettenia caeni]